ncbi:type II secretion system F family protein [Uliginosibacterium gangwonense]|uniref:type II secretion system F family protein n=1 Tax=Uliginosibacterium gangwonense TaxID=392736 RepID=UPI00039CCD43|nr:type II secretion system F family protein [Uliginosibacterium gangwonense]
MTYVQMAFLGLVFLAVFGLVAFSLSRLSPKATSQRLSIIKGGKHEVGMERRAASWHERFSQFMAPLSQLSLPDEGWETSGIRTRFLNAGIRNASAPVLYFCSKTLLALAFPLLAYLALELGTGDVKINVILTFMLCVATVGYYLPNFILGRLIFMRQREIFESFPDALDLMTVCVEAGLGVDAALAKVATDIETRSATLGEELRLVGLELRAGGEREQALRNLAARTGVSEVDSWVGMLVQADRFGTSIASTLRIHSEMLRTKRRQRAEEMAAKIGLKLLFPLIFCIFPSFLLVLLGPAFIQIYRILLPSLTGGGN